MRPSSAIVAARYAGEKLAAYFSEGDPVLYGKYKNKKGIVKRFYKDDRGVPTIEVEPVPKGRKKNKEIGLFKVWHADPEKRSAMGRTACQILPVSEVLHNMREIAKQIVLLEDHLFHPRKRCMDCIRKHLLHIEALAEEAASLATEETDPKWAQAAEMYAEVARMSQVNIARGEDLLEIARGWRQTRKILVAKLHEVGSPVLDQIDLTDDQLHECMVAISPSSHRVAAKFKNKKKVDKADGSGKTTVYEYSKGQIDHRNREKAKRVEGLRSNMANLQAQYKKDLGSADPETRLTALAVALIDLTYERVGNDTSAKEGHFGVTGWQTNHVKFSGGKATLTYVGKSGVNQKKVVSDAAVVKALKAATKDKSKNETILCEGEDCRITSGKVNDYLKQFDVTAKDIRGLHANEEMRKELKRVRSEGPKLPTSRKEKDAILKKELQEALDAAAAAVGHEASTLKSQYLVPGLVDGFLHDGSVMDQLHKKGGGLKVWLDDERPEPAGWTRVYWPDEAIRLLKSGRVHEMSLDHDLGDDDRGTGNDVVLWIEEAVVTQGFVPPPGGINVHSANSSARRKMQQGVEQIYKLHQRFKRAVRVAGYFSDYFNAKVEREYDQAEAEAAALGITLEEWQQRAADRLREIIRNKVATKTHTEKEDEETDKLVKPSPQKKPPRLDLENRRVDIEDEDPDEKQDKKDRSNRDRKADSYSVALRYVMAAKTKLVNVTVKDTGEATQVSQETLDGPDGSKYKVIEEDSDSPAEDEESGDTEEDASTETPKKKKPAPGKKKTEPEDETPEDKKKRQNKEKKDNARAKKQAIGELTEEMPESIRRSVQTALTRMDEEDFEEFVLALEVSREDAAKKGVGKGDEIKDASEEAKELLDDPFASPTPSELAEATAMVEHFDLVVDSPANDPDNPVPEASTQPLKGTELDDAREAAVDRAESAAAKYRKGSKEMRLAHLTKIDKALDQDTRVVALNKEIKSQQAETEAALKAGDQKALVAAEEKLNKTKEKLGTLMRSDPRLLHLTAIRRGIGIASALTDGAEAKGVGGTIARLARSADKTGNLRALLAVGTLGTTEQAKGDDQALVREVYSALSGGDWSEVLADDHPGAPLAELLSDPEKGRFLTEDDRAELRQRLVDMMVAETSYLDPAVMASLGTDATVGEQDAAAKKLRAEAAPEKPNLDSKEGLKGFFDTFMENMAGKWKGVKEKVTGKPKEDEKPAATPSGDESDGDDESEKEDSPAEPEAAEPVDQSEEPPTELSKDEKDEAEEFWGGVDRADKTDAQLMAEFEAKASPEMKDRMRNMTPAEFKEMMAAISDEDEDLGKTAAPFRKTQILAWDFTPWPNTHP